jgi:RNA polymerase sigma-70 factor (ECF subfamily)
LQTENLNLLIKACQSNNAKAQMAIYNLFSVAMYNTAFRIIGEQTQAEEIMHDSFLKAFEKIQTIQNQESFAGWLKRIVINKSINHLKKNKKYQTEELSDTKNTPIYIEEEIESLFEINESETKTKTAKILQTLNLLKSNYKTILTLYYIEGFDLEEIESILQINNQNCRTMLTRAKQSLKIKMIEI